MPSLGSRSLNYSGTTCRSRDIGILVTVTLPSLGLLSENKIRLAAKPGLPLAEINYPASGSNFSVRTSGLKLLLSADPLVVHPNLSITLSMHSHYYLVTTIPTVGSGGNSRRDIQTPPSRHESQLDTPANHFSPRMASCSFSDCYLSN